MGGNWIQVGGESMLEPRAPGYQRLWLRTPEQRALQPKPFKETRALTAFVCGPLGVRMYTALDFPLLGYLTASTSRATEWPFPKESCCKAQSLYILVDRRSLSQVSQY